MGCDHRLTFRETAAEIPAFNGCAKLVERCLQPLARERCAKGTLA